MGTGSKEPNFCSSGASRESSTSALIVSKGSGSTSACSLPRMPLTSGERSRWSAIIAAACPTFMAAPFSRPTVSTTRSALIWLSRRMARSRISAFWNAPASRRLT